MPPPIERALSNGAGEPLSSDLYLSPEVFSFEQKMFERAWHPVAHQSELSLPGMWKRVSLCGESLVIVRSADLKVRALYNVCRHRGVPLVSAERGRGGRFECPYHGFTYELDGRLRSSARMKDVACDGVSLVPVALEEWNGFVFVSIAGEPFTRALHAPPPWLDRASLSELMHLHGDSHELRANWKLVAENFQESDHFVRVHPSLERCTSTATARTWHGDGSWLGGLMSFEKDVETVSTSRKRNGRPYVAAPEDRDRVSDALLFPLFMSSLQPDYFLTYRIEPLSPARTRVHFDLYVHASFNGDAAATNDVVDFWKNVNREDREICEKQQEGIGSRGYMPIALSEAEEGIVAFHEKLLSAYKTAVHT